MELPPIIHTLALRVRDAGGHAFVVGGGVRDDLLGNDPKDLDVEVYGLDVDALTPLLRELGRVDEVGRSFGVLKLTPPGEDEIDVSIPRRDSNAGPGHRGIVVEGDPHMSIEEAARRRDLTVNAILYDPLAQTYRDPYGGREDLEAGVLRAVDSDTFLEDPLRALRAVQFAARLEFHADEELMALCREAPLDELPAERILGEWKKLLVKGVRPSLGLQLARQTHIGRRLFPHRTDDPSLDRALDRLATWPHQRDHVGWRLAAGLLVWLAATDDPEPTLDTLGVHKHLGYPVRRELLRAHAAADAPVDTPSHLRHLSARSEVWLGLTLRHALGDDVMEPLAMATALGVRDTPPSPLIGGAALQELGVTPGPAMGALLAQVYTAQLDGTIQTEEEARNLASSLMTAT